MGFKAANRKSFPYIMHIVDEPRKFSPSNVLTYTVYFKFPSLFYSEFLSKSLHYAQFYSFYAAPSIIIPYLQFKLSSYRAIYSHAIMHKQHNNQMFEVASLLV